MPLTAPPVAPGNAHSAIASLAGAVARAEQAAAAAAAALQGAEGNAAQLRHRVAELEGAKADIAARRRRGEHQEDDGAALALIGLDLEDVQRILGEADAAVAVAKEQQIRAGTGLAAAQGQLQRAERGELARALSSHADILAGLLRQTTTRLRELEKQLGQNVHEVWCLDDALWQELRHRRAGIGRL